MAPADDKLMWQFWSCQMESDRGKVEKAKLCGSLLHPPNQFWLFCCLLQVTRTGLEFQTKVVEGKRLRSANFTLFLFLWRLLMWNHCGRNHWVLTTPDTVTILFSLHWKANQRLSNKYLIFRKSYTTTTTTKIHWRWVGGWEECNWVNLYTQVEVRICL